MAPKSFFYILCLVSLFGVAACAPRVQASPTLDQKAVGTAVAATLEAAATATHASIPTTIPTQPPSLTPQPTLPEPTLPTHTPTASATPVIILPSPHLLVAYTKYNDVTLWTLEDGAIRLTDMHDVVSVQLSDDGELIAFKRQDPDDITLQELWVVNTTSIPNPVLLVSADDLAALVPPEQSPKILGYGVQSFSWRPGTHILAYNTLVLHEGPGFGPNHDMRLVDADTMQKTTLFETGHGGMFFYSPDGSQVALSNPENISLVNADGTNLRPDVLTYPKVITYSEYEYYPRPLWAPDSGSLGVAIPPHDPLNDPSPLTALWHIPADGSPAVLLGNIPAIPFAWPDHAFSPDLHLVGYSMDVPGADSNLRALHIYDPEGPGDRFYDSGESLEFSSWSPDSHHFIYRVQGGEHEGLYSGGLFDQPVQIVADPHSVREIQWLDGTNYVYLVNQNNQWELRLGNLEGSHPALIDTIPDASPAFDVNP